MTLKINFYNFWSIQTVVSYSYFSSSLQEFIVMAFLLLLGKVQEGIHHLQLKKLGSKTSRLFSEHSSRSLANVKRRIGWDRQRRFFSIADCTLARSKMESLVIKKRLRQGLHVPVVTCTFQSQLQHQYSCGLRLSGRSRFARGQFPETAGSQRWGLPEKMVKLNNTHLEINGCR